MSGINFPMETLIKRKGYMANFSMGKVIGNYFLLRGSSLHHYSYCTLENALTELDAA